MFSSKLVDLLFQSWTIGPKLVIKGVIVSLELKPADLWRGLFYKRTPFTYMTLMNQGRPCYIYDVWACIIPMLALHITWRTRV